MKTEDLISAIDVLTRIVQPKINNITFSTQNKAQTLLSALIDELEMKQKESIQ